MSGNVISISLCSACFQKGIPNGKEDAQALGSCIQLQRYGGLHYRRSEGLHNPVEGHWSSLVALLQSKLELVNKTILHRNSVLGLTQLSVDYRLIESIGVALLS